MAELDEGRRELDVRVGLGMFASETQLERLLAIARELDVPAGHVLFERGSPPATVLQVMSGGLEMRAPDQPSWRVGSGGTSGFVDLMLQRRHTRTAVTTAPSRLLEIDSKNYRDYLEDHFEVSHRLLARLAHEIVAEAVDRPEAHVLLTSEAPARARSFPNVELPMVERLMMLTRMPAFRGGSTQGLATLAQSTIETRFARGDVIATAGSVPSMVSLLVEGEVELVLPGELRLPRRGRGFLAHFEELATTPRVNTVVASSPVIVLQIEREELLDRLEEHFDLMLPLFAAIAREQDRLNDFAVASGVAGQRYWR